MVGAMSMVLGNMLAHDGPGPSEYKIEAFEEAHFKPFQACEWHKTEEHRDNWRKHWEKTQAESIVALALYREAMGLVAGSLAPTLSEATEPAA